MAWVAKDYIGEWIFNCKPDMWASDCVEHNYWLPQDKYSAHGFQLPKGSIKKLIGRELNWNDEPVELKDTYNIEDILEIFVYSFLKNIKNLDLDISQLVDKNFWDLVN